MAKIDFSKIAEMLNSSTDFSLTEKQYYNLTRRDLSRGFSAKEYKNIIYGEQ